MPFKKGQSGNPKGKPKGIPDRVSQEARELARKLFDSAYWKATGERLKAGTLSPAIESKLLAYAYGEPKQEQSGKAGITVNIGFLGSNSQPTIEVLPNVTTDDDVVQVMPHQPQVALIPARDVG
jgi:hypothetical protein